jgi:membrane-bound lytic murein transglycosylase B
MGQTQFIPTTFEEYAVDFDHDGRRDVWNDLADALASTSHYLVVNGWHAREPWVYEVKLPNGFDYGMAGLGMRRLVSSWRQLGVTRTDGSPIPHPELKASLLLPEGSRGPAFLVFNNFRALLHYNNSAPYGLAVAWLAERLRGASTLATPWPEGEKALQREERMELQRLLLARGYDIKRTDGIVANDTILALKAYQRDKRVPADGYPCPRMLNMLRADARS